MNRKSVQETSKIWMNYLQDVKHHLDNYSLKKLSYLAHKHHIDTKLGQFLKTSKVIYQDDLGFYRWNQKIPVSIKLINAYRKEQHKKNARKYSQVNKPIQQELNLVVEATKRKKKSSIKIDEKDFKIYKPYQEKKVGLIRKFLRWIY